MGLFKPKWLTIDPNDNYSRKYYMIKNYLSRYPKEKLAEMVINSPNKYVCKEASREWLTKANLAPKGDEKLREHLLNILNKAKFDVAKAIVAIAYYKNNEDLQYVNKIFAETDDEEAKAILSPYIMDLRFLDDLKKVNNDYILYPSDVSRLASNIEKLEKQQASLALIEEIKNNLNDTDKLLAMLISNKDKQDEILNKIAEFDEGVIVRILSKTDNEEIITKTIKHLKTIDVLDEALKDKLKQKYSDFLLKLENKINTEKTCHHKFKFVETVTDTYNDEIRIYIDIYKCQRCGLIKEEERWDNGHSETYYHY